jgi:hypothetical protein
MRSINAGIYKEVNSLFIRTILNGGITGGQVSGQAGGLKQNDCDSRKNG